MIPLENLPLGYIGPDIGLPFMSAWGAILAMLLALLGVLLVPFKFFWKGFKKGGPARLLFILLIAGGLAAGVFYYYAHSSVHPPVRVIVLGMDGLDPKLLETYMEKGLLPNFKRLKEQGSYHPLETTNPALSPVAWSSFITGSNPGRHGVFDFLKRDPQTYLPDLTFTDTEEFKPLFKIGNFEFPPAGKKLKPHRKGVAFWDITTAERIPTTVIRIPTTFPPDKIHGRMLSGFGVPDIRGGQGTFSFYSTDLAATGTGGPAGGYLVQLKRSGDTVETHLLGPRDRSRKPSQDLQIPLLIQIHGESASLSFQREQFDLKVGEWSGWKKITFKINAWTSVDGIVRFHLGAVSPDIHLYVSPVNFDPRNPAAAISSPKSYSKELAEKIGMYHTLGQAEDTWSLNEGRVNEDTFLEQVYQVVQEREAMLFYELNRFDKGLLVCEFDTPDRVQHMFWRLHDPGHPLYDAALAKQYEAVFPRLYQTMDRILGDVLKYVDGQTVLMVLSDHGFTRFRTAVHANRFLAKNGFLVFKQGISADTHNEFFANVDWSQSRAYAVGLAGIYLNLAGRERNGMVKAEEASGVLDQISKGLLELKDPASGKTIVRRVYRREEIYKGPYAAESPDLVVGFEEGYRFSWQTALGAAPPEVMEPNAKRWSGDHCVDPPLVPGIFLANRKINTARPRIIDLAATVLKLLDVEVPPSMDGNSLL